MSNGWLSCVTTDPKWHLPDPAAQAAYFLNSLPWERAQNQAICFFKGQDYTNLDLLQVVVSPIHWLMTYYKPENDWSVESASDYWEELLMGSLSLC